MTLLTEEEARKETCPVIRFCVNEREAVHAFGHAPPPIYVHQNCKASECKMAWRWAASSADYLKQAAFERNMGVDIGPLTNGERRGYCGLAGKPEFGV